MYSRLCSPPLFSTFQNNRLVVQYPPEVTSKCSVLFLYHYEVMHWDIYMLCFSPCSCCSYWRILSRTVVDRAKFIFFNGSNFVSEFLKHTWYFQAVKFLWIWSVYKDIYIHIYTFSEITIIVISVFNSFFKICSIKYWFFYYGGIWFGSLSFPRYIYLLLLHPFPIQLIVILASIYIHC